MTARLAYANLFAADIEGLATFYRELLALTEIEGHRSPIYRCLDAGGIELGFNADAAYDLLGLGARRKGDGRTVAAYMTFEVSSRGEVDTACATVERLAGRIIKPAYETYYNAWQAVLEDPEGNVFRVNHRMGARRPADTLTAAPWIAPQA